MRELKYGGTTCGMNGDSFCGLILPPPNAHNSLALSDLQKFIKKTTLWRTSIAERCDFFCFHQT